MVTIKQISNRELKKILREAKPAHLEIRGKKAFLVPDELDKSKGDK